jgi:hypothetical protein
MYHILPYTKKRAKELGVEITPSTDFKKKLDVYENGKFLFKIGANGMGDYPTYLKWNGKVVADQRRRLYHLRTQHAQIGSKAWYSKQLLW